MKGWETLKQNEVKYELLEEEFIQQQEQDKLRYELLEKDFEEHQDKNDKKIEYLETEIEKQTILNNNLITEKDKLIEKLLSENEKLKNNIQEETVLDISPNDDDEVDGFSEVIININEEEEIIHPEEILM